LLAERRRPAACPPAAPFAQIKEKSPARFEITEFRILRRDISLIWSTERGRPGRAELGRGADGFVRDVPQQSRDRLALALNDC
jgi:hypothetical protein